MSQLENDEIKEKEKELQKSSLLTSQFIYAFFLVGFTAHCEIISKVKKLDERIFYIVKNAEEFWSVETLKHKIKNNLSLSLHLEMSTKQWELPPMKQVKNCPKNIEISCPMQRN